MVKIRRTNQGGSTILFGVMLIILILVLVAGFSILKQRGEQARRDQAIATVNQQKKTESAKKTEKTVPTAENNGNTDKQSSATSASNQDNLPATGSKFAISEFIGAGLIVTAIVSYKKSRRRLSRYL